MDKLDKLTEIMLTIKKDTEEIKKENKAIRSEIQDLREEWKKKQEEWEKEKRTMENRLKEMEIKEEQMKKKMTRMIQLEEREEARERRERKNNIIVKGEDLPREGSPKEEIEQIMRRELQVEVEVEDAYWIRKEQRGRMLIAKLKNWQQKKDVLAKKSKLKAKSNINEGKDGKEKQIGIKATIFRKDQVTDHQTRTGATETDFGSRTDERDIENSPDATYREVTKLPNEEEKRGKIFVAGFWNVAGLFNKDRQFWKHIENYDAIGLTETWVDEKQWEKLKDKLPDKFIWKSTAAKREKTKGRARGGIITGIRRGVKEEETTNEREDIQKRRVILNNTEWRILTVYSRNIKETVKDLRQIIHSPENRRVLIGGDFNARIGDEGTINWENSNREIRRKSRDKIKNAEGRTMLELIEEEGWSILNGNMEGDEAGEWTYIGACGNSVIDYGIVNAEAREDIVDFAVEERIESDYLPIRIDIYFTENGANPDVEQEETSVERRVWTEEGKRNFAEKTEDILHGTGNRRNGRRADRRIKQSKRTESPGHSNSGVNETTEPEENEDEITGAEIRRQIAKLKNKKAPGEDGLENEVWINGSRKVIQRGITLLNSAYKIYAMVLEERLKAEIEDKNIIAETQTEFRRGRSTIDNIFILNYITNRELVNKGGKIYAFFADLSATFDKVDREELNKIMERTGISQKIRKRIGEIYQETRNVVRVNGHTTSRFWTTKGVRQGCPLSPTLFMLYTADLEERMRKDDIVLLARSPEELKEMISRFRKYLEKKKLTLNAEKSKVMIFKKGRGRKKKEE
ncbi:trichohyalin-like [Temnothorax curvispinosus]|uniref:Trichohyalin-like n=1 Tax=Temnothorax curvispinosus TaxID=300111 RepID=A0A6J1PXW5_9HYME|nr:trichohyalin-like [Temnothorax curvispinosus]